MFRNVEHDTFRIVCGATALTVVASVATIAVAMKFFPSVLPMRPMTATCMMFGYEAMFLMIVSRVFATRHIRQAPQPLQDFSGARAQRSVMPDDAEFESPFSQYPEANPRRPRRLLRYKPGATPPLANIQMPWELWHAIAQWVPQVVSAQRNNVDPKNFPLNNLQCVNKFFYALISDPVRMNDGIPHSIYHLRLNPPPHPSLETCCAIAHVLCGYHSSNIIRHHLRTHIRTYHMLEKLIPDNAALSVASAKFIYQELRRDIRMFEVEYDQPTWWGTPLNTHRTMSIEPDTALAFIMARHQTDLPAQICTFDPQQNPDAINSIRLVTEWFEAIRECIAPLEPWMPAPGGHH